MSRPGGAVTVRAARSASRPRATVPGTKPPGIRAREGHLQSATHSCVTYGPYVTQNRKEGPHMSTKSALRADLDAEDRKTLAEDRKRMERLGKGSQLDDWLAFGPGLLIPRRLAKNIAGLAETDPAKGRRHPRAFKEQMEMDGLYDRTTNAKSDVMKSTFTAVLWFYDDEKLEARRREILEEIR